MRKCICRLRLNEVSRQWGRRPKLPPNASCSCISCSPTGCPPRGEVGRRPASGRSSRPGTSPLHGSADLTVQLLDHVVGTDARPVLAGKITVGQRFLNAVLIHDDRHQNSNFFVLSAPVAAQVDAVHADVWIVPAMQGSVPSVLDVNVGFLVQLYNFLGHSLLSPFRMVCGNFILPEPACYVFFYAIFNLRTLLYIIFPRAAGAVSRDRNRTEIGKPRRKTGGAFGLLRKERDRISISAAGRISRAASPRARGRTRCVCGVRGSARGCAYAAPCTCGSPRRPRTGTGRRRRGSCP